MKYVIHDSGRILAFLCHAPKEGERRCDSLCIVSAVVSTLQANVRPTDRLSRHGGEEFLLLMPDTDAAGAQQACERLRQLLAATPAPATGTRASTTC